MALEGIAPVIIRFGLEGVQGAEQAFQRLSKTLADVERGGAAAAMRSADERVKARKKEVDESVKLEEHFGKMKTKVADESWRGAQKALEKETREAEKEYQKRERDAERAAERLNRIDEAAAKKRADAVVSAARHAHDQMEQIQRRYATHIGSALTSSAGRLMSGASMVMGAAAGIGGGFAIADVVRERAAAEKQAALLVNLVSSGGVTPAGANVESILKKASEVSIATGMSKADIVEAATAYASNAKGGDFRGVMANLPFLANFSQTFGVGMSEAAQGLGALQSQNQSATPEELRNLMLAGRAQSVQGVVSMAQLIPQLGNIGATAALYSGDIGTNQRKLMAAAQIAATVGSHEEAGTYVKDIAEEAVKKRGKAQQLGIRFNGSQIESLDQSIEAVFRSGKGSLSGAMEVFGARGSKLFEGLLADYKKGAGPNNDVDAGVAAVMKAWQRIAGESMTDAELQKQHAESLNTSSQRIQMAFNQIREKMDDKLAPALEHFAVETLPKMLPYIEKAIDGMDHLARFLVDNPIKGIGAIIIASIAKDVGSAMIGEAVKQAIIRAMVSSAGASGVAGAAQGGAGMSTLGKAGIIGAVAVATAGAGVAAIDYLSSEDQKKQGSAAGRMSEAESLAAKIRSGNASPEDFARAKSLKSQMAKDVAYFADNAEVGMFGKAVDIVAPGTSEAKRSAMSRAAKADNEAYVNLSAALMDHVPKLVTALENNTKATTDNSKGTGPNSPRSPANPMTDGSISARIPHPPQGPGK